MTMHHALEHVHNLPKASGSNVHVINLDQPITETDLTGALDGTQPTALFRREAFPSGQDGQSRLLRGCGVRWACGSQQDTERCVWRMIRQVDGDDASNVCMLAGGGTAAAASTGAAATGTARHLGDLFFDVLARIFRVRNQKATKR